MAYDKTYDEYIKRTQGQGSQMPKELFEQKRREMLDNQMAEEKLQSQVDRGEARKIRYSMDGQSVGVSNGVAGISQPQQTQPKLGITDPGFGIRDNSALISDSFENQKSAALTSLKAAIQKAKGGYQATISSAPQQFTPLKDQTTVAKNTQLTGLREAMANQGQQGGVSRSEQLQVETSAENKLNSINQQQQSVIDEANRSIAQLEADGDLQGAQIAYDSANNKIRALIEEANRVESVGYARGQDELQNKRYESQTQLEAQRYAEQQRKQAEANKLEQDRYTTEFERRAQAEKDAKTERETAQKRADFAATINPKEDLTAIINNLEKQGVAADDYRITELKKARINKVASMDQANFERELANMKSEDERQETALEYAWKKFNSGLPADAVTATLLKIKPGTVIPKQKMDEAQLALDKIKASKTGGSSKTSTPTTKPIVSTPTIRSQIDKNVTNMVETRDLDPKDNILRQLRADEILKYSDNGQLTDKQAMELIATYGLTQAEIEQAERRKALIRSLGGN